MTNRDRHERIDTAASSPQERQRFYALPYQGNLIKPGLTEYGSAGQNFAVRAGQAPKAIDLCIFDTSSAQETQWSLAAYEITDKGSTFAGFIPELKSGALYNLIVSSETEHGLDTRALLDPYAKAFYQETPYSPLYGVVVEPTDRVENNRIQYKPEERVIYETHVKGATMLHPDVPEQLRGTYLGFSHPAHLQHLKDLGITTVELEPVMQFASEPHLLESGKTNYWGYNPVSFFAPHAAYASNREPGAVVHEFKEMMRALHEAGIEVILDVVYNHTADGGEGSPPYSLKGLDEKYFHTYFDGTSSKFHNFSGCGNTINTSTDGGLQLTIDSLRYWADEMGVDGFRFDLAASLIRNNDGHIDSNAPFFAAINNDPTLKERVLIAEPWDLGAYPEGIFARRKEWLEWSGPFRDITRDFWGIGPKNIGAIAKALSGPVGPNSLNFITAHDGFTINDLVSFSTKHNEANGENNRDGTNDNRSWNHGMEGDGPAHDESISQARLKTIRNMLLTLLLSHGTPMILGGDEFLRTQGGNNNAYCQDNEITWMNWDHTQKQLEMTAFVKNAIHLRKNARLADPGAVSNMLARSPIAEPPIVWLNVWGENINNNDVNSGEPVFGRYTSGQSSSEVGDSLLYYINGSYRTHHISLPKYVGLAGDYELVANTATGEIDPDGLGRVSSIFAIQALSSLVLRRISSSLPSTYYQGEAQSKLYIPDARHLVGPLRSQ